MKIRVIIRISLLSLFVMTCISGVLNAQSRRIRSMEDLFSLYEQERQVESITISPSLLKLAKSANSSELDEVFNAIASLRILNLDITPETTPLANRIRQDVRNLVRQEGFEEIVKMKDGDSDFVIYLSQNKDKNSKQLEALLMVASEESELVLIGISGKITRAVIDAVMDGKIGIISK